MKNPAKTAQRQPRYQRLAEALLADIRSGALKVGMTVPGEHELVARHSISRYTVREALRRLTALGLIERRQGIGTVVRARETLPSYAHTVRTPAELLRYPPDARLHVQGVKAVRLDRRLARELSLKAGGRWTCISALRRLRGSRLPICWVDIYVLPEYASVADLIGRRATPVYEVIEQTFGEKVTSVAVEVQAELVPAPLAAPLQVEPGSPSLRIVRRYLGQQKRVFEVSVSHHPGDRYAFALELQRGWSADAGWQAS